MPAYSWNPVVGHLLDPNLFSSTLWLASYGMQGATLLPKEGLLCHWVLRTRPLLLPLSFWESHVYENMLICCQTEGEVEGLRSLCFGPSLATSLAL